jgi:ABC-type lipoprotein export system ATPase subunit
MVTHDAKLAAYGDRTVNLKDGRVVDDNGGNGRGGARPC